MTDLDMDETVPPISRKRNDEQLSDLTLAIAGVVLAAFAAFFPWYVFFNKENFEIKGNGGHMERDLPEAPFRNVVSISPIASRDNDRDMRPPESVDDVKTSTVPQVTDTVSRQERDATAISQPLPAFEAPPFQLLHVNGGKALIQDSSGMYIVGVGGVLPDNSRVETIELRAGKWALITSKGDIIE